MAERSSLLGVASTSAIKLGLERRVLQLASLVGGVHHPHGPATPCCSCRTACGWPARTERRCRGWWSGGGCRRRRRWPPRRVRRQYRQPVGIGTVLHEAERDRSSRCRPTAPSSTRSRACMTVRSFSPTMPRTCRSLSTAHSNTPLPKRPITSPMAKQLVGRGPRARHLATIRSLVEVVREVENPRAPPTSASSTSSHIWAMSAASATCWSTARSPMTATRTEQCPPMPPTFDALGQPGVAVRGTRCRSPSPKGGPT